VFPLRGYDGRLNFSSIFYLIKKNTKIWVEYGSGRTAHILVLLSSFITSKPFILNVHDFTIQERYFNRKRTFLKEMQLDLIENLLLKRANVIILAWPGLLNFFNPAIHQKVIVMAPGIEVESLCETSCYEKGSRKKALYFGGMKRKDIIPHVCSVFSKLDDWNLHLVGLKEGESIFSSSNIKYIGLFPHAELNALFHSYDVILIPLPVNKYTEYILPMKTCYALGSCRPVIMSKLPGLTKYIMDLGLSSNVIFVDNWDDSSINVALAKSLDIKIDCERTREILARLDWSRRFDEVITLISNNAEIPQICEI
jgi:hypothetical protein